MWTFFPDSKSHSFGFVDTKLNGVFSFPQKTSHGSCATRFYRCDTLVILVCMYVSIQSVSQSVSHLFTHSFIHSFIKSIVYPFVHSLIYSLICSFNQSIHQSIFPSLMHSLTHHSFIYSFAEYSLLPTGKNNN